MDIIGVPDVTVYIRKTDSLEPSLMLLMLPIKAACKVGWFPDGDIKNDLLLMAKEGKGPQLPSNVAKMIKYGVNLLEVLGDFEGQYIIAIAIMNLISSPNPPQLQDYVQPISEKVELDGDICQISSWISLNCPISQFRIKTPVKGYLCKHPQVLDQLISKYEATSHGPEKWQKLTSFLRHSLEGPIPDLVKKQIDNIMSEKSSLNLKCRSIEDKMELLSKQLEASETYKSDYFKRYEDAINDKKKLAQDYMTRITNLQKNSSTLDERCSSLSKTVEATKHESMEWKRKYELSLSKQKAAEDQAGSEVANLKARSSAAEARLEAAREQTKSAQEEAQEWKRKFDLAVKEAKSALENHPSSTEEFVTMRSVTKHV